MLQKVVQAVKIYPFWLNVKRKVLEDVETTVMTNSEDKSVEETPLEETKSLPPQKKKSGPLSKLLGDIFSSEKLPKNHTDRARNEYDMKQKKCLI